MGVSFGLISEFVSGIFKPAADLIDNIHTSEEEKLQAKAGLLAIENDTINKAVDLEKTIVNAQKDIIISEAKGESWLQRNWRPILMLVVIAIIANNYLLAPYIGLWTDKVLVLDLPTPLFALLTAGVGGYVVGRSGEKIVDKWKE
jgi:hypothetical protein